MISAPAPLPYGARASSTGFGEAVDRAVRHPECSVRADRVPDEEVFVSGDADPGTSLDTALLGAAPCGRCSREARAHEPRPRPRSRHRDPPTPPRARRGARGRGATGERRRGCRSPRPRSCAPRSSPVSVTAARRGHHPHREPLRDGPPITSCRDRRSTGERDPLDDPGSRRARLLVLLAEDRTAELFHGGAGATEPERNTPRLPHRSRRSACSGRSRSAGSNRSRCAGRSSASSSPTSPLHPE